MKIIEGTVLSGVGAAVLLLSALASGSSTAAPTSSPSSGESTVEVQRLASGPQMPATVPVSVVKALREDGTVDFQVARFVRHVPNNRKVEAIDGLVHTAVLAADAEFLSTTGCDPWNPVPPSTDEQGLGTVPCDRAAFAAMTTAREHYAPAIFYNDAGEISKIAHHYHP